jgi:hypothetical protein
MSNCKFNAGSKLKIPINSDVYESKIIELSSMNSFLPQYLKTVTLPLQEVTVLQGAILNSQGKTFMF